MKDRNSLGWQDDDRARAAADAAPGMSAPRRLATNPERILVGLLCPIGDTLFATPALAALRRRFPNAHITALVSRSNTGILDGNPALDARIICDEGREESGLVGVMRHAGAIKRSQYDLMVNISPSTSFIGYLARVPDRMNLTFPRHWWLMGGHHTPYRSQHAAEHYLDLIRPLLGDDLTAEERQPRIYLAASHRTAARRLLREAGLTPANPLVTMHVGADGFRGRKRWSTARFARVGTALVRRFGMHVLLVGGPGDRELGEAVVAAMRGGVTNLAGRTSLMETAALIERSTLFIGNDSCPLHIAAAVGTPAVGIYGPSNVEQFRPLGGPRHRQRVVQSNLPCSPCYHFVGTDAPWVPNLCHSYACLKAINADDVIAAAASLLRGEEAPPEAPARPPLRARHRDQRDRDEQLALAYAGMAPQRLEDRHPELALRLNFY
ncbi:MAG TPA: glycosyltransferase family 9 protein [Ktedonobacterales bacterium]|nr:glycosyltransferase family 9 protein [Ktedonobacterales bacterium]